MAKGLPTSSHKKKASYASVATDHGKLVPTKKVELPSAENNWLVELDDEDLEESKPEAARMSGKFSAVIKPQRVLDRENEKIRLETEANFDESTDRTKTNTRYLSGTTQTAITGNPKGTPKNNSDYMSDSKPANSEQGELQTDISTYDPKNSDTHESWNEVKPKKRRIAKRDVKLPKAEQEQIHKNNSNKRNTVKNETPIKDIHTKNKAKTVALTEDKGVFGNWCGILSPNKYEHKHSSPESQASTTSGEPGLFAGTQDTQGIEPLFPDDDENGEDFHQAKSS